MNQNKESQKFIVEFNRAKKNLRTKYKTKWRLKRQFVRLVRHNDNKRLNTLPNRFKRNNQSISDTIDTLIYLSSVYYNNYPI